MQRDIYIKPRNHKSKMGEKTSNGVCLGIIIVIACLLLARDAFGIAINKYIFLLILAPALLFFREKYVLVLWMFLMPLYVGLPGNYITLIILFRFITQAINEGKLKIYKSPFILTVLLATFVFVQNIVHGYIGVYYMIFVVELFVVYFFVTTDCKNYFPTIMLSYSFGIAMTGIIMLVATLQTYSFNDLLSVATRLGYVGRTTEMTVIIDPNYYGLFAITALACNWQMITKNKYSKKQKTIALIFSGISIAVALIGLSRAFILCFAIWMVLSVIFEKKISLKMKVVIIGIVCIGIACYLLPNTVQAIIERFASNDMQTGNGRTVIFEKIEKQWESSVITMLFGIGLFDCNVHFMQMQYFFGLGIVGAMLMLLLGISYWNWMKQKCKRYSVDDLIPIVIIQISASSVPTAQSLTFMMPVVMSLIVFGVTTSLDL